MSESAVIVWERQALVANRVRHTRYLKSSRLDPTQAGKAYWINAAREVRLTIAEGLDMLYYLTTASQGKH